jgi:hypothetical protein
MKAHVAFINTDGAKSNSLWCAHLARVMRAGCALDAHVTSHLSCANVTRGMRTTFA